MLVTTPNLFIGFVRTLELVRCAFKVPFSLNFPLFSLVIGLVIVILTALRLLKFLLLRLYITMFKLRDLA